MVVTAEVLQEKDTSAIDSSKYSLSVEQRISQAEYLCAFERFSEADSILRTVLNELEASTGGKPNEYLKYSDQFSSVFGIYKDLIPPDFLSEDIIKRIETHNFLTSLDSMIVGDGDSILPVVLQAVSKTSFDIPMVFNERVQKACFYYLLNNRKTVENWVKRSSIYAPITRKMFADSSLPPDLAYLPLIESGFNAKAYSRAHASGIWQFIPSTGKLYGLRNSYWVDERRDPLKATSSAIRYLKKLYKDFGDWHLALAAYNCGEGNISRAIKKSGSSDYWKLQLPKETMNYVPLYLASIIIIKNLEHFGFSTLDSTLVLRTDSVVANECIDLAEIAKGLDIDEDTLRLINPHILHWCTPPDVSYTRLYLPEGKTENFKNFFSSIPDTKKVKWYRYRICNGDNLLTIGKKFKVSLEAIKSVNRLSNNRIVAGKHLFIPIPIHGASALVMETIKNEKKTTSGQTAKPSGTPVQYKVKKGDTIWGIADLYGVEANQIYAWNNLSIDDVIKENDVIEIFQSNKKSEASHNVTIPGSISEYQVVKGDTPYSIAGRFDMSINEFISLNNLDPEKPAIYNGAKVKVKGNNTIQHSIPVYESTSLTKNAINYQIAKGDNLFRIAQNFDVTITDIQKLNNLSPSSVLKVGDVIQIPHSGMNGIYKDEIAEQNIVYYEVKRGDNLWRIAGTFGIPVQKLCSINNLTADSVIMPGDVIKVLKAKDL
jgi:membrane-bound lytic murein transglycosylase D